MTATLTFARLTLREALRRRLVLAVFLLTVVIVGFVTFGFSRLTTMECGRGVPCSPTEIRFAASLLLILVVYAFDSVIAVGAAFLAAPAIASEIENGLLLALLPRPIHRRDVVVGKWLGLATLIALYAAFTLGLQFLAVWLVVDYLPPQPVAAVLFITAEGIVLMTLALLLSTRLAPITGAIVTIVLFGVAWLGGIAQAIGLAFENVVLTNLGTLTGLLLPTDGLWRSAIYSLEPVATIVAQGSGRMLAANPFFVAAPPPTAYYLWAAGWTLAVLALAAYSFAQRDL